MLFFILLYLFLSVSSVAALFLPKTILCKSYFIWQNLELLSYNLRDDIKKPKWVHSTRDLPFCLLNKIHHSIVLLSKKWSYLLLMLTFLYLRYQTCVLIFSSEKHAKSSTLSCSMQSISLSIPKNSSIKFCFLINNVLINQ